MLLDLGALVFDTLAPEHIVALVLELGIEQLAKALCGGEQVILGGQPVDGAG